ncbi:hypothetical protein EHS25_009407 [Saitozyma podzolica]|uniref:SGS domain-containing protein n=1 Tax=Saitozyma podzolica TaxID=1890683 RepID=A0A427YLT4_9TREE|nr:hypothetical protein EHS25_009407 [Saitozyma podzolica]
MDVTDIPLPRYDFYQTPSHLILAVYVKGYGVPGLMEHVGVTFQPDSVVVLLPPLKQGEDTKKQVTLGPLWGIIKPEESTVRVLSSKIELKLAKNSPDNWTSLLGAPGGASSLARPGPSSQPAASSSSQPSEAGLSAPPALQGVGLASNVPRTGGPEKVNAQRRNWDKVIEDELEENDDSKDPNAGGDAALQKMFSSIYANADPDTRRAMIKSFTESGGTALSTDWSNVGKEKTPVRPPEGMYEMKM